MEYPEEKIYCDDEERGVDRRRDTRRHVAYAQHGVGQHRLPVIQRRLFEPRTASENGRDPVMPREHLARHLRVAGLVSPYQAELSQAVKEKKRTESSQQQGVCARAIGHGGKLL